MIRKILRFLPRFANLWSRFEMEILWKTAIMDQYTLPPACNAVPRAYTTVLEKTAGILHTPFRNGNDTRKARSTLSRNFSCV
jgi:hypothetical protein